MRDQLFPHARLHALTRAICERAGSAAREAELVADNLVLANLLGHDSHGVGMIPNYLRSLKAGTLFANRHAAVVRQDGAYLVMDGQFGYGQVVAHEATQAALARARETGVCVLALRNARHVGRVGHWGEICAAAGFIAIHYVNAIGFAAQVAPFGGSDARFSTNPYCTAIPAAGGRPPLVLDFATAMVAQGKVRVAYNRGVEVPEGALINHAGRPTRDPQVLVKPPYGAILPMGQHKGYGLALVVELLAGALSGGGTYSLARIDQSVRNNMLAIVIDPARFGAGGFVQREIEAFQDWVAASPPAAGGEGVMLPGDPERKTRAEREAAGVPVDARTWEKLLAAGETVGLTRAEALNIAGANR
ncbi:MAG: malate/lactate/ureidoglycolate dehydrogenase [Alphaproteobacteria bacterium]|nr:malate/lactate/ureidoglycolate dehydrogenase [Alphaproteobacteria bacterium]